MTTRAFINGELVDGTEHYENIDPSTGESLGSVTLSGPDEVNSAVSAARNAQGAWASQSPEQRAGILENLSAVIREHADELAVLESEDSGKPLSQAKSDALVAARYFQFYGRAIDSYYGVQIPVGDGLHVYTRREPLGVVGSIVAWNYPMQLLGRVASAALATGNAVVLKPGDETPRTAVRIAELAIDAGLPPGVFNVIPGIGIVTGAALSHHPDLDHIGFVGSSVIGTEIAKAAAQLNKSVTLELGGKSPHVVFPDADLERATESILKGILTNAGQTCSAGSRLVVHESVADELVSRVSEAMAKVEIGPGVEDKDLGPLVSKKQQTRVHGHVAGASGEIVTGGKIPEHLEAGSYFEPTLIFGVDPHDKIAQEEVFGPVLVAMTFSDEDEAVSIANATEYGLMAGVWTRDIGRAHRLAAKIVSGQVYINSYGAGAGVEFPFGGFRRSGYGREKGLEGLDSYTATKTVIARLD